MNYDSKGCLPGILALAAIFCGIFFFSTIIESVGLGIFFLLLSISCGFFAYSYKKEEVEAKVNKLKEKEKNFLNVTEKKKEKIKEKINVEKFVIYENLFHQESIIVGFGFNDKKMAICDELGRTEVIKIDSVFDIEILHRISSNTHTTTENKGALGRAVVGGLIAGGTGALIGATTSKKEHYSITNTTDDLVGIRFYIKDPQRPYYDIDCKDKTFLTEVYTTTLALL